MAMDRTSPTAAFLKKMVDSAGVSKQVIVTIFGALTLAVYYNNKAEQPIYDTLMHIGVACGVLGASTRRYDDEHIDTCSEFSALAHIFGCSRNEVTKEPSNTAQKVLPLRCAPPLICSQGRIRQDHRNLFLRTGVDTDSHEDGTRLHQLEIPLRSSPHRPYFHEDQEGLGSLDYGGNCEDNPQAVRQGLFQYH